MGKEYKQLSLEERCMIAVGLGNGLSKRAIARLLKRPSCTVIREINRNAGLVAYTADEAQRRCQKRKKHPARKLAVRAVLWAKVQALLLCGWSPEQVSGKLKRMCPNDPEMHVSHETIYAHIYAHPRGGLRTELIKLLRKHRKKRMPRARGKDRRGQLHDITPIAERPKDVETRAIPGHWEGDLIKGKYNRSAVGTLVERTSRYVILVKLDNATAPVVHQGFVREMQNVPETLRLSLTYDRGKEMALHKQIAADLNLRKVPPPRGTVWRFSSVREILTRRKYTGTFVFGARNRGLQQNSWVGMALMSMVGVRFLRHGSGVQWGERKQPPASELARGR